MKVFSLFILIAFYTTSYGQNCNCTQKFQFVRHEIETNYAGYTNKVNDTSKVHYFSLTKDYLKKADKIKRTAYCLQLIRDWLLFFKDGHLQAYNPIKPNMNDTDAIKERIKHTEVIDISSKKIQEIEHSKIKEEGIYYMSDSSYKIAIVKSKTEYRDFAGVILESKYDLWKPGQVKMELKKKNDSLYNAILYMRDHSPILNSYNFTGTSFDRGNWNKAGTGPTKRNISDETSDFKKIQVKKLSDSTLYIQIGTFNFSNYKAIDSTFKAYEKELKSVPNLIIDVRKNGGGADASFEPILPYLYTNPIIGIGNDIYVTEDNVQRYSDYAKDPDMPDDRKKSIMEFADEMKKNIGTFINHAPDDTATFDKVEPYPKKVAILIENHCASTTEEFLLIARQSKKVTLMGQSTYGELDYSNMLKADSPCSDLEFYYSSTVSRRIKIGLGIDGVGIKPDIQLPYSISWIKYAQDYLEK